GGRKGGLMSTGDQGHDGSPTGWRVADDSLPHELRHVARWYVAQATPEPTPEATQRLMARLRAEGNAPLPVRLPARQPIIQTLRMVRWQLYLLSPWFWITSAVFLVLGMGAAPFLPQSVAIALLIYALPLTAVLSAVYALPRTMPGLRDL